MVQHRAIWRTNKARFVYGLSNGAIFNDLERPLKWFLRSRHSLTLNISQTAIEYGHSYYRRRIGNRTKAFEWHQFQWRWVTSNPRFQGHDIIQRQITRKWYKIELYLQWRTNRKLHICSVERRHFNDLERPLTWFSRSRHSLTLNISQTATDTAIITTKCE